MTIHLLQDKSAALTGTLADWASARGYSLNAVRLDSNEQLPELFEVDLLVCLDQQSSSAPAAQQLLEACQLAGRPVLTNAGAYIGTMELATELDRLATLPRHNYRRIDCGYYDHIELSIIRRTRRPVRIRTFSGFEELTDALLTDTRTVRGEEYVQVDGRGWVRADWVELVGVSLDGSCATE